MAIGLSHFFPALPILFIISIFLLLLPVPGFVRGRNAAVLFYISWLFLGNAVYFVHMLVWKGNLRNIAAVYCDITSLFLAMLPVGIACSLLCVNKLVWNISRSSGLSLVHNTLRSAIDFAICFGVPLLFGGLHIMVQDKRYVIVEDVGCMPSVSRALPSLFIYYLPPPIICCCIASAYCTLSVVNLIRNRHKNSLVSDTATTAMSFDRYLRLTLLCITSILLCAIFLLSILVQRIRIGFTSWESWANVPWDFSHVKFITADSLDKMPHEKALLLIQILPLPILGFHFFLFFGIGSETLRHYGRALDAVLCVLPLLLSREPERDLEPPRTPTITEHKVLNMKRPEAPWVHYHLPRPIFSPPVVPPPALLNHSIVIVEGTAYPFPSLSRVSSRSNTTSPGVSTGSFTRPPCHLFDEGSLSPLPLSIPATVALEAQTVSTRSRFSLYSDRSPVQERQESWHMRLFSLGRRPVTSV